MKLKKKSIKIHTLQKDVSSISEEVRLNPDTFYEIQKYNDNIGYLISPELAYTLFDYLEELEMLQDRELMQSLEEAQEDVKKGNVFKLGAVIKEIEEDNV